MDAMLRKALRKYNGLRQQLDNVLLGEDGDVWEEEFKKFLAKRTCWPKEVEVKAPKETNPFLKSLATGTLEATTGERTLAQAGDVFTGHLDPDFVNWQTDVKSQPTKKTPFEVLEQAKDGTFAQIFGAFNIELDKLCWSQDQIITFVEKHSDLLHPEGYATFFLFKVDNEFFVALARRLDGGLLEARVYLLSYVVVWLASGRTRFVVPQLTF